MNAFAACAIDLFGELVVFSESLQKVLYAALFEVIYNAAYQSALKLSNLRAGCYLGGVTSRLVVRVPDPPVLVLRKASNIASPSGAHSGVRTSDYNMKCIEILLSGLKPSLARIFDCGLVRVCTIREILVDTRRFDYSRDAHIWQQTT